MLSQLIKNSLEHSVRQVFTALGAAAAEIPVIVLEQPANPDFGDYSSNIAMQLAKILRKAPMAIAELITTEIAQSGGLGGLFSKIDIAAPGFINLYINWQDWAGRQFGLPEAAREKVIIEHTSVNPNKSMHIGHLRNSCIGDVLVRILRKTGYSVEVHNYVDDLGNQLADTVVGLLNVPLAGEHVRFGDYCWDIYAGVNKEYALHPESVLKRTEILHGLEKGDGNTAWLGTLVAERIVREHVAEMKGFDISYDLLVWESSILKEGFWASAFALLAQTEVFVQESEGKLAGCWILKQAGEPAESDADEHHKDKVLVRSNGILTYTAKDIAYHLWKFGLLDKDFRYSEFNSGLWTTGLSGEKRAFGRADRVVNVIDYRQEYPQAMVKQALEVLGYTEQAEKLHHVSYGVVSLSPASAAELGIDISDGKTSYAMSGRQGIGIKVTELLQLMEQTIEATRSDKSGLSSRLIATAAIRYYLLRFNLGTEIIFDFKQATEISGNTGVYLMYTYARAGSVLSKGGALAVKEDSSTGIVKSSHGTAGFVEEKVNTGEEKADSGGATANFRETAVNSGNATPNFRETAANSGNATANFRETAPNSGNATANFRETAPNSGDTAADFSDVTAKSGGAANSGDATANSGEALADSGGAQANYTAAKAGSLPVFPAGLQKAELALLRHLSTWQDTLHSASVQLTPNTVCNYAHTLASLFNNFYSACPILKGEPETVAFRLWLTQRFKDTLGEVLEMLGLPRPERM